MLRVQGGGKVEGRERGRFEKLYSTIIALSLLFEVKCSVSHGFEL